jgi:hypothetical protein
VVVDELPPQLLDIRDMFFLGFNDVDHLFYRSNNFF